MIEVIEVKPKNNYLLELKFNNQEVKYFDIKPYLNHGKFSELQNLEMFKTVKIFYDTINWSNGVDIDPEVLYEKSYKIS